MLVNNTMFDNFSHTFHPNPLMEGVGLGLLRKNICGARFVHWH